MLEKGVKDKVNNKNTKTKSLILNNVSWVCINIAGVYLFKVNSGNTRITCEICLKLTKKTPE